MLLIDQLAYRSKLREKNPMWKAALAAGLLVLVVGLPSFYLGSAVIVLMGCITVGMGKIPLKQYLRLMRIPLVFILLSVAAIMVNISKQELSGFTVQIGSAYVGISILGIHRAANLCATALGAVSCLYFLALSTPMTDILYVLGRVHCPSLLIELMILIYRFIFILMEISRDLGIAQKSRLGNCDFRTSLRSTGALMAVLFLRSFQKSSRLYDAMESRCYDGRIRVLYETKPNLRTASIDRRTHGQKRGK